MGSKLLKIQPALIHVPTERDVVFTPRWLSKAIIEHFHPVGVCLDPCRGKGAFYDYLPARKEWCEIDEGRDFLLWNKPVDWCIGNPPYSVLLEWIRHSFKLADNVCYLIPLHRVMASSTFLQDVSKYGGIAEILHIGTGTDADFPFGHALTAVHYKRGFRDGTVWSTLNAQKVI